MGLFKTHQTQRAQNSNLTFDLDSYSNYPIDDFKSVEECSGLYEYSFYCYALIKCSLGNKPFYLLRVSDIIMINGINILYYCPAYKKDSDIEMAKRKSIVSEPNKLNLTPGKVTLELDDLPQQKLDYKNSVYDPRLKRRVPITTKMSLDESETKKEKESAIPKQKKITPEKQVQVKNEMVNNIDVRNENELHSSDFLPPFICTRLWVLRYKTAHKWAWFMKDVEGSKSKSEYYCRPIIISDYESQYDRGGSMFTLAFEKSLYQYLDKEYLGQDFFILLRSEFKESAPDVASVVIDSCIYDFLFTRKLFLDFKI